MKTDVARKIFIEDWTHAILRVTNISPDGITKAYVELAVSQIMDASLKHKKHLDIDYDCGYELKE